MSHRPRHAAVRVPNPGPPVAHWLSRAGLGLAVAIMLGVLTTSTGATPTAGSHSFATGPAPAGSATPPALRSVTDLSRGAPTGAKVIPAAPVHVAKPAPADPQAVSALAADGIPAVALNAYRVAAARMASAEPSCGIDWSLLAAIGRVESDHGRYGGAQLLTNGLSTIPVIGPALTGTQWDYIADTDGGRLDGDPVYDHAVGPMQFIPSTWAVYGVDADGDGVANPFDINDAALAAARYLCAAGGDLRTAAGQRQAVLAYNHSDEYLALVLATAAAYAAGTPVGAPITGITSGPLPGLGSGVVPPANPGPMAGVLDSSGSAPATASHRAPARSAGRPASGTGSAAGTGSNPANGSGSSPASGDGTGAGSGAGSGGQPGSGSGGTGSTSPPVIGALPSPTVPVSVAPVVTSSNPVADAVCTVTGLLGSAIPAPCPTH